ncbi:M20/M25/M40 family metallo-hydrolase [Loigolactobacillus coryniformis]|uniref:M20/M25/M40 family metallo-hydrolase n=1 Tax=Loigolactobacillus coryniformis TaxID=1610 RepID=A0A5B8TEL3_9LACO|nr:M20/M25/M40 family metallo-hydrolase [Loigolactobacillus coryniformis]QEA52235.1 M20/M25/M40 family metallo-hydrolase [Loigolactobacillus coryniformis]
MGKQQNIATYQAKLAQYIKLGSVSAQYQHIQETAQFLKQVFTELGGAVRVFDEHKFPLVFADFPAATPAANATTVLFYNHYDVQPAEPLALWRTDPWTLTKQDGKFFGRGIADCKGDLFVRLTALKNYLDEYGQPPVHIKFLVEGAEEIASQGLDDYFKQHSELFQSDLIIWESGTKNERGQLRITGGNKGISCFEISADSASRDLHSSNSAIIDGALWHLIDGISSLHQHGKISVAGFYDNITAPTLRAKNLAHKMYFSSAKLSKLYQLQYPFLQGDNEEKIKEAYLFAPSFNIEGISGGYEGASVKTVLPAHGGAKFDMRLVPGQDPADVADKVAAQLYNNGFGDLKVDYTMGVTAYRSDMDAPLIKELIATAQTVYGGTDSVEVLPTSAGTGPSYNFNHYLHAPIAAIGISNPNSGAHAPNENVTEADYLSGIEVITQFFANLSAHTRAEDHSITA